MTHPMLEKVARAIAAGNRQLWEALSTASQASYLRAARAAVQALLEPDEGMVEAGEDAMIYTDSDFIRNQAERVFRAMLLPLIERDGE